LSVAEGDASCRIQEATKELAGAHALVATERLGEEPVDAAANEGEQDIEVDVQGHGENDTICALPLSAARIKSSDTSRGGRAGLASLSRRPFDARQPGAVRRLRNSENGGFSSSYAATRCGTCYARFPLPRRPFPI